MLLREGLFLGVDGCRDGWITAVFDHGELRVEHFPSITAIIERYPRFDAFLIDMVIGLRDSTDQIRPDDIARKELGRRSSTLFPVPSRKAVYAETEEEQKNANIKTLGKSLAKQSMAIIPKIRELDEFFDAHPAYRNRLHESHPELSFARLNGEVVMTKKKEPEGLRQREMILNRFIEDVSWPDFYAKAKEFRCNPDDILDAICLCVTAGLEADGLCETIPDKPEKDEKGLLMELTVPKSSFFETFQKTLSDNREVDDSREAQSQEIKDLLQYFDSGKSFGDDPEIIMSY